MIVHLLVCTLRCGQTKTLPAKDRYPPEHGLSAKAAGPSYLICLVLSLQTHGQAARADLAGMLASGQLRKA